MKGKELIVDKENIPPSLLPDDNVSGGAYNGLLLRTKVKSKRHSAKAEASVSAKLTEWSNRYSPKQKTYSAEVAAPPPTFAAMPSSPEIDDSQSSPHGWSCSLCRRINSLDKDKCSLCCSIRTSTTTNTTPIKTMMTNVISAARRHSPLPPAIHEKQA